MKDFFLISSFSLISILSLSYQTLDNFKGGCVCTTSNIAKTLLFRQHASIRLFDMEISFALLGLGLMSVILLQTFLIGTFPVPITIPIPFSRKFTLTPQMGQFFYYFLVFQIFGAIIALFNLLYIELFVIKFICLLCTISQVDYNFDYSFNSYLETISKGVE